MNNTIMSLFLAQFLLIGMADATGEVKEQFIMPVASNFVNKTPNAMEEQEQAYKDRANCILRGTEGPLKYVGALSTSGLALLSALNFVVGDDLKIKINIGSVILSSVATLCASMAVYAHQNGGNIKQ